MDDESQSSARLATAIDDIIVALSSQFASAADLPGMVQKLLSISHTFDNDEKKIKPKAKSPSTQDKQETIDDRT